MIPVLRAGLAASAFTLLFFGLAKGAQQNGGAAIMQQNAIAETMQVRAEETYRDIRAAYYVEDFNLFREHEVLLPEGRAFAELWPYSGVLSAVNALAAMPDGEQYEADLVRVLEGLEQYFDQNARVPAYDSYVREFGGGQKYYDDNEWLGLDFIAAYRTLGDPGYLEKARVTFEFAISGWSDDLNGGIYWRENDLSSKNTCSNGPAAVLALMLYLETQEEQYLEWGIRILEWAERLKAPSGVYWDNVASNGVIDYRTYTYNTGTILHANALLYQITGDEQYLSEARALADASLSHFLREIPGVDVPIFPATPWFNAVLLRGYLKLYEVDPEHDPRYIETFRRNLDYAWEHARGSLGFFNPDWAGDASEARGSNGKEGHYWLLDQAAMVELYALLSGPLPFAGSAGGDTSM
jgi:uncharacterized protein YyaL (SSP411 family)